MPSLTDIIRSDPLNKAGLYASIGVLCARTAYETSIFHDSLIQIGPFLKNELAHGVTTFTLTSLIYDYMRMKNNSNAVSFATALAGGILWNGIIETAQYYSMGKIRMPWQTFF